MSAIQLVTFGSKEFKEALAIRDKDEKNRPLLHIRNCSNLISQQRCSHHNQLLKKEGQQNQVKKRVASCYDMKMTTQQGLPKTSLLQLSEGGQLKKRKKISLPKIFKDDIFKARHSSGIKKTIISSEKCQRYRNSENQSNSLITAFNPKVCHQLNLYNGGNRPKSMMFIGNKPLCTAINHDKNQTLPQQGVIHRRKPKFASIKVAFPYDLNTKMLQNIQTLKRIYAEQ